MSAFGEIVRKHRVKGGMSMNALARVVGVDPAYICRIENPESHRIPSRGIVLAICDALSLRDSEIEDALYAAGLAATIDWRRVALAQRKSASRHRCATVESRKRR